MEFERNLTAAMDIGNSRVKVLYKEKVNSFNIESNLEENLLRYFGSLSENPKLFAISYVNTSVYISVSEWLDGIEIDHISIEEFLNKQKLIDFRYIKGIGQDRMLGLIGSLKISKPPLITIDCGTATTINYLDSRYKCRGGVILPGPYTQLNSLSENTSGLDSRALKFKEEILADNTEDAISNGIIYGIAGGIKHIVDAIMNGEECDLILTGGGCKIITGALDSIGFDYKLEEALVLNGIMKLIEENE